MGKRPAAKRMLASTPSNTQDMSVHALTLQLKLKTCFDTLVKDRGSFADLVHKYQLTLSKPGAAIAKVNSFIAHTDAEPWAPAAAVVHGQFDTCLLQWSYDARTMWRGAPQNPNVFRIAKSIIAVGFRKDCPCACRCIVAATTATAASTAVTTAAKTGRRRRRQRHRQQQ